MIFRCCCYISLLYWVEFLLTLVVVATVYFLVILIIVYFQGSIAVAGGVVRWLRDNLQIIKDSSDIGIMQIQ